MLQDTKRYLEAITKTTHQGSNGYLWTKVGDIHLSWQKDSNPRVWDEEEVAYYKNNHNFAWYLAKDMTIAAGSGYWFVDLESFRGGVRYQLSKEYPKVSAKEDLFRKHELYIICVLRDLSRVTTQLELGRTLLKEGPISTYERQQIQEKVLQGMIKEANKSEDINLELEKNNLKVELHYPSIGLTFNKKIPIKQISPIY